MTNESLYRTDDPAAISLSGGRTSAYMLWQVLKAYGGSLPDNIQVVFANTGKEMGATLDFVRDIGLFWDVPITWLELGDYEVIGEWKTGAKAGMPRYTATTKIVTYETASRNGEPFERLCRKRNYLPNLMARFCTAELKVRRIRDFLNSQKKDREWTQFIGIRADEPRRAAKIHGVVDSGHELYCPLFLDGVLKSHIFEFWKAQSFDLDLYNNNGTTDFGNCDLCFLKGGRKKISLVRERPDLADWWIHMESLMSETTAGSAARFRNDQPSYAEMKVIATDQPALFDFEDDETIPCFCGD